MLAVMAVPMWGLLLLIIPLEAYLAKRILSLNTARSFKLSVIANAGSTLLGVPLTWVVLAGVEIGLTLVPNINRTLFQGGFLTMLITSPWLYPIEGALYWMIPAAAIVLLIPFFFASVWSEYLTGKMFFRDLDKLQLKRWAWRANYTSYALMLVISCGCLFASLYAHNREMISDEHRNVDTVSEERLWQIADTKLLNYARQMAESKGRLQFSIGPTEEQQNGKDQVYWKAREQEEAGHLKEAEKLLREGLAKIDSEEYQKSTSQSQKHTDGTNVIEHLADLLYREKRYAESIPLYERVMKLEDAEAQNPQRSKYFSVDYPSKLPISYENTNQLEKAENFFQVSLQQAKSDTDSGDVELTKRTLAYADYCNRHEKYKLADELYTEAAIRKNEYDSYNKQKALLSLAEFLISRHEYKRAEKILNDGIALAQKHNFHSEFGNDADIAPMSLQLAKCYNETNQLDLAEHHIKVALRGYKNISEAAETYAKLFKARGNISQSKLWESRANAAANLEATGKSTQNEE